MSTAATSYRPTAIEKKVLKNIKRIFTVVSSSPKAKVDFEGAPAGFHTTDGRMVACKSVAEAVSAGKGMFVGGYFVGVADEGAPMGNSMPFIRY